MLVVVSGPSGVGKSRLIEMAGSSLGFRTILPYTTRQRRPNEAENTEYVFVTKPEFKDLIRRRQLFDWDYTLHNYYGCPRQVETLATEPAPVIIHALARMAVRISMRLPNVVLVFLRPHSQATLTERLALRNYSDEEFLLRQEHWREEQEHASMFDIVVEDAEVISAAGATQLLRELMDSHPKS
jgi:guanylate kinase